MSALATAISRRRENLCAIRNLATPVVLAAVIGFLWSGWHASWLATWAGLAWLAAWYLDCVLEWLGWMAG